MLLPISRAHGYDPTFNLLAEWRSTTTTYPEHNNKRKQSLPTPNTSKSYPWLEQKAHHLTMMKVMGVGLPQIALTCVDLTL